ncbi:metallophosphoesterase [Jeotgalibacillus marinus]|uniref:Phosphoesterase n=1 Tax=Jeotgalibacillus marinus TaxID=86667 RepID=A0ABV3PZS5_9BACL
MKVLVISDNHGDTERIVGVKKRYEGKVDAMFHCGDSELPFNSDEMDGFIKVRGNCDFDSSYPDDKVVKVLGTTVFMTHGHLYGIKSSLDRIYYKAAEVGADLIFFGHSHTLGAEVIENRLFVNPGSILLPRGRKEATYAIVERIDSNVDVCFYDDKHEEITSWNGSI